MAPNGDDNRSAKQASHIRTPWKTIQKCASLAEAGNTCVIRAGTYRETVTPAHSGQAGRPITFRNYPGEKVIIKALKLSLPAAVS